MFIISGAGFLGGVTAFLSSCETSPQTIFLTCPTVKAAKGNESLKVVPSIMIEFALHHRSN